VKKRFSEEQIIGILREADKGVAVKELCRKHGFSEASYYLWRSKFGGMDVSDAKRLKGKRHPEAVWCASQERSRIVSTCLWTDPQRLDSNASMLLRSASCIPQDLVLPASA
jgi:transposase-like protein